MRSPKSSTHDCPCFVAACLRIIRKKRVLPCLCCSITNCPLGGRKRALECGECSATAQVGQSIYLDELSVAAGGPSSDRVAFKTYALQRLHAATFRGVALLINSRPVLRTGAEVPPERGALPLSLPPPLRAVINFSSHLCFPHNDSTNTTITTPRTTPAT